MKKTHLKEYITALEEINNIMAAMRNLALLEINKITRFLSTQEQAIKTLEDVYSDFTYFFPQLKAKKEVIEPKVYIVIGSERGFCGNFNDELISELKTQVKKQVDEPKLIIVGRKLAMKFIDDPLVLTTIDSPSASEEIPSIILRLIQSLENYLKMNEASLFGNYYIIYNTMFDNHPKTNTISPLEKLSIEKKSVFSYPPILNLAPQDFLPQFLDQYLFAFLYLIFYQSFFTENSQRFHHTDTIIQKLNKQIENLTHRVNILRQEEITEEIEIILLSAETLIKEFVK